MYRLFALTLTAACMAGWAAPAASADFGEVYEAYLERGAVNGCSYSPAELSDAVASIPADIQAYDPGFADALTAALAQRATGCGDETFSHLRGGAEEEAADGSLMPQPPLIAAGAPPSGSDDGSGVVALVLLLALGGSAVAVAALLSGGRPSRRSRSGRLRAWLGDVAFVIGRRLRR